MDAKAIIVTPDKSFPTAWEWTMCNAYDCPHCGHSYYARSRKPNSVLVQNCDDCNQEFGTIFFGNAVSTADLKSITTPKPTNAAVECLRSLAEYGVTVTYNAKFSRVNVSPAPVDKGVPPGNVFRIEYLEISRSDGMVEFGLKSNAGHHSEFHTGFQGRGIYQTNPDGPDPVIATPLVFTITNFDRQSVRRRIHKFFNAYVS